MTEATQAATTTDAREASMSRVQTQDSILAKFAPTEAAKEPPAKADEPKKDEGEKPKKPINERIQTLVEQRREAEAKAEAEKRRADELDARLQALTTTAKPIEAGAKPLRSQYTNDDEYIDALTDYKAREAIAKRELEQAEARADAEAAEIAAGWSKRQDKAMKEMPDYADVIGKSEIIIPPHIHQAILESEQGPHIAYYLALHPEEAKRIAQMKPIQAIKRVRDLERDLSEINAEEPATNAEDKAESAPEKPQKSKAPPPIEPVKSVPSSSGASTSDYAEYKRRRLAGK